MTFHARLVLTALALALCAACAQMQPDSSLPGRYDSHSPEGDMALWGGGD